MAYSKDDTVLLAFDRLLQFIIDLDLRLTDADMFEDLRYRIRTSGLSKETTEKVIALINHVEEHGGTDNM